MSQSFRIKDPRINDCFWTCAAEELGQMEMVATKVNLLNGHQVDAAATTAGNIQACRADRTDDGAHERIGLSPGRAPYGGTPAISRPISSPTFRRAAGQVVYQYLYRQIIDSGVGRPFDFSSTASEAHNTLFAWRSICSRRRAPCPTGASRRIPGSISTCPRPASSSARTT